MKTKFKDYVLPFSMFLITICIAIFTCQYEIDNYHDAVIIKPALDILNGKTILKDSFTGYGPYWSELMAIPLKMGGTFYTIRLMTAFVYGFITIMLYYLWKRILPNWAIFFSFSCLTIMTTYITKTFYAWPSVYTNFLTILAICLFVSNFEYRRYWKVILAGVCTGLCLWIKQPMIAFTYIGIISSLFIVYVLRKKILPATFDKKTLFKDMTIYSLVTFLSVPVLALPLVFKGTLGDWFQQNIVLIATWSVEETTITGGDFNVFQKLFLSLFPMSGSHQYVFLVFLSLVFLIVLFAKKDTKDNTFFDENKDNAVIPVFIVLSGLVLWLHNYPYALDLMHMYWAGMIMFGTSFYALLKMLDMQKTSVTTNRIFAVCCFLLIFAPSIVRDINLTKYRIQHHTSEITSPYFFSGLKVTAKRAQDHEKMLSIINKYESKYPDGSYVNLTKDGIYSCFFKVKSPTIMWANWGGLNNVIVKDWEATVKEYAVKNKSIIVTTNYNYDYFVSSHDIVFNEVVPSIAFKGTIMIMVPKE